MTKQEMAPDLDALTLTDAVTAITDGTLSAEELMQAVLARARQTEATVHAYVHLDEDQALEAARTADRHRAAGTTVGPLHGVPIGIKDLIATSDMPTAAGSAVLAGHQPAEDADVVRQLKDAGAIMVGKHCTHEFGLGTDEPPTRNPWDLNRYPGGSTVGGAVSVAVGSCLAALGTDGGGSIRKPASINGIVGLKPTTGAVSTKGIIPGTTTMDHVGWLTRTVPDAALLFQVLSHEHDDLTALETGVNGLRLGIPSYFLEEVQPDILEAAQAAVSALRSAGATIIEFNLPALTRTAQVHEALMSAESYRLHELWLEERGHAYHPASREALLFGAQVSDEALTAVRQTRHELQEMLADAFTSYQLDALVGPTLSLSPVPLNEMGPQEMLPRYCRLTLPFNVTGSPALSVPCGFDQHGLPVGVQIAGRLGADQLVLRIGRAVELAGLWEPPRVQINADFLLSRPILNT